MRRRAQCVVLVAMLPALVLWRVPAAAEPASEAKELREEIRRLKDENDRNRRRMEELERKVEQLEAKEGQKQKEVETTVAKEVEKQTAEAPRRYLDRYFGENRFVLTGYGAGTYEWHQNTNTNTFTASFAPILLYRVTDRVLFEAEPEFELTDTGETDVNLEYAQADIFLNDYATFVGGKFLLPFGEFIQQLHPAWINKLVSFPLPYEEDNALQPFSDVGVELRGGASLFGREGVDVGYTIFGSNGPRFESNAAGAPFETNNVDNNRGKAAGARLAVYPLPVARDIGRLELGASTFDGPWSSPDTSASNLWFTSWGIDAAYQLAALELRGEYLETYRAMPSGVGTDRRQGWYAQLAYKLAALPVPYMNHMEVVMRYSGVNRPADPAAESLPHPRQVALGLDYWLTPSVVGKLEYDRDIPKGAPNDNTVRAQVAVGF